MAPSTTACPLSRAFDSSSAFVDVTWGLSPGHVQNGHVDRVFERLDELRAWRIARDSVEELDLS